MRLCVVALLTLAGAAVAGNGEFRTAHEGGPAVAHVKLMRSEELKEYWAWVTLDHEDWPIETRRFLLHPDDLYPDLHDEVEKRHDPDWSYDVSREDLDRVYTRGRAFPSPYRHYVDWWIVLGPKGEHVHRRDIEVPHPGGWPFMLLERSIKVPVGITKLTFKAHDPIHGYGTRVVTVDLLKDKGADYEIEPLPVRIWTGRIPSVKRWFRGPNAENIPELW